VVALTQPCGHLAGIQDLASAQCSEAPAKQSLADGCTGDRMISPGKFSSVRAGNPYNHLLFACQNRQTSCSLEVKNRNASMHPSRKDPRSAEQHSNESQPHGRDKTSGMGGAHRSDLQVLTPAALRESRRVASCDGTIRCPQPTPRFHHLRRCRSPKPSSAKAGVEGADTSSINIVLGQYYGMQQPYPTTQNDDRDQCNFGTG
jgi:hypothetical protein